MKTRLNTEQRRLIILYALRQYRFEYRRFYIMPIYMERYYIGICEYYNLGFISAATKNRCYYMMREYKRRWNNGYYK